MAELIQQILSLSKAEQLQIMAVMIENMKQEEGEIPAWQLGLAKEAFAEIEQNPETLLSEDVFWKEIDAKVEALESKGVE